jgi:beta-galactosidase
LVGIKRGDFNFDFVVPPPRVFSEICHTRIQEDTNTQMTKYSIPLIRALALLKMMLSYYGSAHSQAINLKNMIGFTVLLLSLSGGANAQSQKFNNGWKFIGLEFANQAKIDSSRRLGNNWADQFMIEKSNVGDPNSLGRDTLLMNALTPIRSLQWQEVRLPHTAFPEPLVIVRPREGLAFYKKEFFLDKNLKGKNINVEFEGAMQVSDVWFNGKYAGHYEGGYLPFEIDISALAVFGGKNEFVLRVNNKANPVVPPGKPVEKLDFIYYSGIYRDVWMHIKSPLHITNAISANKVAGGGIFVTYPVVNKNNAIISVQTNVKNNYDRPVVFNIVQELINKKGTVVARVTSSKLRLNAGKDIEDVQRLEVKNPALWHPDHPSMYQLRTSVMANSKIVDTQITGIGIRSFELSREKGLLINGEPFRIRGTNRHQNYPYIGNALSNEAAYRDAWLIKSSAMNAIRSAHYPPDPSFLDAADELGILILDCIPGWQYLNTNPVFKRNVMRDIRQMIRRDRNHPSILLWEASLNETYPDAAFRCEQAEVARSEWRGSPNFFTSGDSYFTKACWDVPYDDSTGEPGTRNNMTYPDRPFLIREYGDYEFGGGESSTRQLRSSGEKGMLQQAWNFQWSHNKNRKLYPAALGDLTWAFYDGLAGCVVGIEGWGVADIFRIPKYGYYFFKSQQPVEHQAQMPVSSGPVTFIASNWDRPTDASKVVVYSNCDSVSLFLNGKKIAVKGPDHGPETAYGGISSKEGHWFNGGNANHLDDPPFTFKGIEYAAGRLTAVGFKSGNRVVEHSVSTPKSAAQIAIELASNGKAFKANGDVIFVYARLLDKKGSLVTGSTDAVTLSVSGDAKIISPLTVNAEAGIATFILQSGAHKGKLKLTALTPALRERSLLIEVH